MPESRPLAYPADGLICKQCGMQCSECGNEECECDDDIMVVEIDKQDFDARYMTCVVEEG